MTRLIFMRVLLSLRVAFLGRWFYYQQLSCRCSGEVLRAGHPPAHATHTPTHPRAETTRPCLSPRIAEIMEEETPRYRNTSSPAALAGFLKSQLRLRVSATIIYPINNRGHRSLNWRIFWRFPIKISVRNANQRSYDASVSF